MGRPGKTIKEKKLSGTRRIDREKKKAKKKPASSCFTPAPKTLTPYACGIWDDFGTELNKQGLLQSVASFKLLELYCEQAEIVNSCENAIKKAGGLEKYLQGKNSQTSPELAAAQKARTAMQGILSRLERNKGKQNAPGTTPKEMLQELINSDYSGTTREELEELHNMAEELAKNIQMETMLK